MPITDRALARLPLRPEPLAAWGGDCDCFEFLIDLFSGDAPPDEHEADLVYAAYIFQHWINEGQRYATEFRERAEAVPPARASTVRHVQVPDFQHHEGFGLVHHFKVR